jgi:hypothetical protein
VYVQVAAEPSFRVIDASTGEVVRTMPAGTPSPDWRWLYRISGGAVDVLDAEAGLQVAAHPAPSWAQVVRTSADGRLLVFARSGPWDRFQVQNAAWTSGPVDVALQGSFTFDGISADGRRLYLLEWLGADRYHVRMYDLVRGALAPYVIVDKLNISEDMSGTALASFATRTGEMQLTLYQRAPGRGGAFVHALPIGQPMQWAFCVDLPGPSIGWAFAAAPDGRRFYAANPADGRVVELNGQRHGRRGGGRPVPHGPGHGPRRAAGRRPGDVAGRRRRLRRDRVAAAPSRPPEPGPDGRGDAARPAGSDPSCDMTTSRRR